MQIIRLSPQKLPGVEIQHAPFPAPFGDGLEYSPAARGTWTIMHLGLLIPQTHVVFVCAQACLRGVVMSAAEVKALDRFSTITVEDKNLLEGDTEQVLLDGIEDILSKIRYKPRGMIIYTSCVHEFIGSDLTYSFAELRRRHPEIDFADGYMAPIVRKRITPDARNRRQILALLKRREDKDRGVTLVANVRLANSQTSDLRAIAKAAGVPFRDITEVRTYEEYQTLAKSSLFVTAAPFGNVALAWCEKELGGRALQLTAPWVPEEIDAVNAEFAAALGVPAPDFSKEKAEALELLKEAREAVGARPVSIDASATARPLSLARLLVSEGFTVSTVFTDALNPAEKEDYEWLKAHAPALMLRPISNARMADAPAATASRPDESVAIGQKAAYFMNTRHFINMIEADGTDGYRGLLHLARELKAAALEKKPLRELISVKALGCTRGGCL